MPQASCSFLRLRLRNAIEARAIVTITIMSPMLGYAIPVLDLLELLELVVELLEDVGV